MSETESPASVLRRAAVLMRERAEAATPGPWWSDDDEDCWRLHGVAGYIPPQLDGLIPQQVVNKQIIKAPKRNTPYAEYWPEAADDVWIITMHPGIGAPLADWLDAEAERAGGMEGREDSDAYSLWLESFSHPLAVARAYLGGAPEVPR